MNNKIPLSKTLELNYFKINLNILKILKKIKLLLYFWFTFEVWGIFLEYNFFWSYF